MSDGLANFRGAAGRTLADETLVLMGAHDVALTAANFEVWQAYKLGALPELNREIETRIARGEAFGDAFNAELFERFFASKRVSAQMLEASASIARELADVISTLRGVGAEAGSYASALQDAAARFEGDPDPADLRAVVAQLSASTREMAKNNRKLSEQMEVSSRQVETLQSALQSVQAEALTDGLTGLANRRLFDETLSARVSEADAGGAGLCLLMCDIDHFKRFNDTWGHLVGDQVIRFIAVMLRKYAEGDVVAARYGGEEFALIMPRTKLSSARLLAVALNEAVKAKRLSRRSTGELLGAVTVSVGIAEYRSGESVSSFIARADACLYASKRGGRDQITTDAEMARAA